MRAWVDTITFGDILIMATFIVTAILSWSNLNWRVTIIETWKDAYYHSAERQDTNINLLRENAAKLTAIIEGQERRLILLEDRQPYPGQHRAGI